MLNFPDRTYLNTFIDQTFDLDHFWLTTRSNLHNFIVKESVRSNDLHKNLWKLCPVFLVLFLDVIYQDFSFVIIVFSFFCRDGMTNLTHQYIPFLKFVSFCNQIFINFKLRIVSEEFPNFIDVLVKNFRILSNFQYFHISLSFLVCFII